MGNVLRAMKKSASRDGPPGEAVVNLISEAVARAEDAAKATLDEQTTAEVLEEELDGLASEPPTSTEQAEQDQRAGAGDTGPQSGFSERLNPMVLTFHQPRCLASEQIRQLRTVLIRLANRKPVRCMITSAQPREGKSVTAANLAYAFSEISTKRTLLIDGDLRRGSVPELLGLPDMPGLADLLAQKSTVRQVVTAVGRPNLHVVTAGRVATEEISRILSDDKAGETMQGLIAQYDHVILDCPPALGVADAGILGRWVDSALLVTRIHKTPKKMLEQAARTLENAGVSVAGLIALDEQAGGRGRDGYGYSWYT